MKLKQLLKVIHPNQRVHVQVYAYGFFYGSSLADGMKTVEDVLLHVRGDVLDAKVILAVVTTFEEAENDFAVLHIQVELCK